MLFFHFIKFKTTPTMNFLENCDKILFGELGNFAINVFKKIEMRVFEI